MYVYRQRVDVIQEEIAVSISQHDIVLLTNIAAEALDIFYSYSSRLGAILRDAAQQQEALDACILQQMEAKAFAATAASAVDGLVAQQGAAASLIAGEGQFEGGSGAGMSTHWAPQSLQGGQGLAAGGGWLAACLPLTEPCAGGTYRPYQTVGPLVSVLLGQCFIEAITATDGRAQLYMALQGVELRDDTNIAPLCLSSLYLGSGGSGVPTQRRGSAVEQHLADIQLVHAEHRRSTTRLNRARSSVVVLEAKAMSPSAKQDGKSRKGHSHERRAGGERGGEAQARGGGDCASRSAPTAEAQQTMRLGEQEALEEPLACSGSDAAACLVLQCRPRVPHLELHLRGNAVEETVDSAVSISKVRLVLIWEATAAGAESVCLGDTAKQNSKPPNNRQPLRQPTSGCRRTKSLLDVLRWISLQFELYGEARKPSASGGTLEECKELVSEEGNKEDAQQQQTQHFVESPGAVPQWALTEGGAAGVSRIFDEKRLLRAIEATRFGSSEEAAQALLGVQGVAQTNASRQKCGSPRSQCGCQ
ncbi:hypothetical protein cyc_05647 [Cyclospora cayetanensis]|uniref:Uncharacterized protein n=1 Tax=Cyclospora cayetanensis TaxID=88456 RepID=A0A1D3CZ04_9EIME|nr:hypothetical protein cyc_05647 [Cyclospora cayetanensis]